MELTLKRETLTGKSTIGRLYKNGKFECFTLEDRMREDGRPVSEWKVKSETAIPVGKYKITIAPSPKRGGRLMPLLLAVPGFVGIQIHSGNTSEDTEGCILLGTWKEDDAVRGSKLAYDNFFPWLQLAINRGELVTIEILNPDITAPLPVNGIDS